MPKGKRKSKKRDERKMLTYIIANKTKEIQRKLPTETELRNLYSAVENNQISLFGVKKLSSLNLDQTFSEYRNYTSCNTINEEVSDLDNMPRTIQLGVTGAAIENHNILQWAIKHSRDAIVSALIKAGVAILPTSRGCNCLTCTYLNFMEGTVSRLLRARPYQNQVWLLRVIWHIQNFSKAHDTCSDVSTVVDCSMGEECFLRKTLLNLSKQENECIRQVNVTCESLTNRSMQFPECRHRVCAPCFWTDFSQIAPIEDIRCPLCGIAVSHYPLDMDSSRDLSRYRKKKWTPITGFQPESTGIIDQIKTHIALCTSADTNSGSEIMTTPTLWSKQNSLDAWLRLPCTETDATTISQRPPFRAMSLEDLAAMYLGRSRDGRCEELEKAVAVGDTRRICALFRVGVDVDHRNEYGQTPAMLACLYDRPTVLQWLLSPVVKADGKVADAAGITPRILCEALGKEQCLTMLHKISFVESNLNSEMNSSICNVSCEKSKYFQAYSSLDLSHNGLEPPLGSRREVRLLIDSLSGHPGAGSFYADGFIPTCVLRSLIDIHKSLPEAPPEKLSCSHRSYICDSLGWIRRWLGHALAEIKNHLCSLNMNSDTPLIKVTEALPHMRFLEYRDPGGALAPHVDLTRRVEPRLCLQGKDQRLCYPDVGPVNGPEHSLRGDCKRNTVNKIDVNTEENLSDCSDTVGDVIVRSSTHTFILYLSDCGRGGETRLLRRVPGRGCLGGEDENTIASVAPQCGRLLVFPHLCPHSGSLVEDVPKLLLRGECI